MILYQFSDMTKVWSIPVVLISIRNSTSQKFPCVVSHIKVVTYQVSQYILYTSDQLFLLFLSQ